MNAKTNGLPQDRQAAVEHGLTQYHSMAAERDAVIKERDELKIELRGLQVSIEAQTSLLSEMESRTATAMLVRDQAVAERAVYESLFVSIQAQLRAFNVPTPPLVKNADESPTD